MFCPQCGASNADNSAVCVQCGRNLQPGLPPPTPLQTPGVVMPPGGAAVPNHLVWSILATVLCCLPSGIVAIVYSAQVNSKLLAGDIAGAQISSKNAKTWCWVSLGLGLATIAVSIALSLLGVIAGLNQH